MTDQRRTERLNADALDVLVQEGLRLHVTRAGTGPPLLLLHGFTGSSETWNALRATLGTAWTTLTMDLAGHGRSGAPNDPSFYTLEAQTNHVLRALDTLGLQHVSVLGYSLGGRVALRFALEHPARVTALILESTSPGIADPEERAERQAADSALASSIEQEGIAAFVDRWERLPMWDSQAALSPETRGQLHVQRMRNDPLGLANSLRGAGAGADPPQLDRLARLRVPTLLIAGALDDKFVALSQLMERTITGARLTIVADAGHAVHLERPETFAQLVENFLLATRDAEVVTP